MNLYPVAAAMTKQENNNLSIASLIMLIEAVSADEAKGKAFDIARKEQGPSWVVVSLSVLDTPLQRVAAEERA